ncbi:hypothetical protein J5X92_01765 [Alteromonas sp. K632G]|uniref:hypothetical protein n=1 Tax=Alteromonas sp. K632G TaxID=2820757 RepID=UPI001AD75B94|nr:hypothetical protein [Alteromonas sp. K632G]MBO7920943.1 hypothetical protein [Alteromonas sp. K632G]
MSYNEQVINGIVVEEYVTARIVRIKSEDGIFKFFAQSEGEDNITVYLGHGNLSPKYKKIIKIWAKKSGIRQVRWGRGKEAATIGNIS